MGLGKCGNSTGYSLEYPIEVPAMRPISLDELKQCATQYHRVKSAQFDEEGRLKWRIDAASLKIAIAHAESGKQVYVIPNPDAADGRDHYLLSDKDRLDATVCANHIGEVNNGSEKVSA